MRVELTGFSQGISLTNKEMTINYLDFKREDGKEFRLPVSEEALQTLMAIVYEETAILEKDGEELLSEIPPGATEFDEELQEEQEGIAEPSDETLTPEDDFVPESEEGVPSV